MTEHVHGIHHVTSIASDSDVTASVLEAMGYEREGEESEAGEPGDRIRYRTEGERATVVDLLTGPGERGTPGVGTVHHVAFRTPDDDSQMAWRDRRKAVGLSVTPQTDPPGFTRDESVKELGTDLELPEWLEDDRERIERELSDIGSPESAAVN